MEEASIRFEELSADTADLLQEITSPGLKKNSRLPPDVAVELRKQQIVRLERNITILRRKQEEFHKKMEDYITSLRGLISNLRKGTDDADAAVNPTDTDAEKKVAGTYVRCVGCGSDKRFPQVVILFAKEPDDMFSQPTEVIVQQDGQLKKGVFRCPKCGDCNLSIRPA